MAWDSTSLKTDSHTDSNCPFISASLIWKNNTQSVAKPGHVTVAMSPKNKREQNSPSPSYAVFLEVFI